MKKFKPVKGYEDRYAVTEDGRVFSLNYHRSGVAKELSQISTSKGYKHVLLYDKFGEPKWFYVHQLVAEAFIPNIMYLTEINHKDEDKGNNTVDNLEWCTRRYNVNYGTAIQRRVATRKANLEKKRAREAAFLMLEEKRRAYEDALANYENYLS